jgi:hypothetical protein
MDIVLSLVGEVALVLCFALAFYVLAADGATNRRVMLCAVRLILLLHHQPRAALSECRCYYLLLDGMWSWYNWYGLFGCIFISCTCNHHMVYMHVEHCLTPWQELMPRVLWNNRNSRIVIGSVFIGMFVLVIPLVLFFRVQSHFRLTYLVHAVASILLAIGVMHRHINTLYCHCILTRYTCIIDVGHRIGGC